MRRTLHDLIINNKDNWNEIKKFMLYFYEDNQEQNMTGYLKVFDELQHLTPTENVKDFEINIESSDELGWDVYGKCSNDEIPYSLSYERWEDWLGYLINNIKLPEPEIIAHCLYEITWNGFNQEQIQKNMDYLRNAMNEIKGGNND